MLIAIGIGTRSWYNYRDLLWIGVMLVGVCFVVAGSR